MKNIVVRKITKEDYEVWKMAHLKQLAPQNIWDNAHKRVNLSKKNYNEFLKKIKIGEKSDRTYVYGIFDSKKKELLGLVMAMDIVRSVTHSAFLGYVVYNQYWGKGVATNAISKFFKIAFTDLKLHRLQAGIEPENKGSLKVIKKLKMRKEGLSKRIVFLRSDWRDLVKFAITAEELNYKFKIE